MNKNDQQFMAQKIRTQYMEKEEKSTDLDKLKELDRKVKRPANLVVENLPKGFTTSTLQLRASKKWNVSITAPKDAEQHRFPIEVKLEYPAAGTRQTADVVPVDNMMQAFYYTHHIQASELALDVVKPSPYR